ncbi:MAG: DUF192 domain-containing protein [Planctomycetes bacterium]|nr:DUF192 domain-containing protein [Planctomycetota bacterium]
MTSKAVIPIISAALGATLVGGSCTPSKPNRLDALPTVDMTIKGQPFRLWVAESTKERDTGLMYITQEEMAPLANGTERGMIFVFDHSIRGSFWMKNTIIPLDIAYVATDGTVVTIHTMIPLDTRWGAYPPAKPYRYAIEVRAGRFQELSVKPGDVLDIPAGVLKDPS